MKPLRKTNLGSARALFRVYNTAVTDNPLLSYTFLNLYADVAVRGVATPVRMYHFFLKKMEKAYAFVHRITHLQDKRLKKCTQFNILR